MVSLRYIRSYKCFHFSRNIRHEIEKACSIKRAKFKKKPAQSREQNSRNGFTIGNILKMKQSYPWIYF
jgi:ribosome-binding protein aMBF1 (putative translation factor)